MTWKVSPWIHTNCHPRVNRLALVTWKTFYLWLAPLFLLCCEKYWLLVFSGLMWCFVEALLQPRSFLTWAIFKKLFRFKNLCSGAECPRNIWWDQSEVVAVTLWKGMKRPDFCGECMRNECHLLVLRLSHPCLFVVTKLLGLRSLMEFDIWAFFHAVLKMQKKMCVIKWIQIGHFSPTLLCELRFFVLL